MAGSYSPYLTKTELYSFDNESWQTTTSYPYGNQINMVVVLNIGEDFLVFGGNDGTSSYSNKIVKFTTANESWSQVGELKNARQGHGVIQIGESFLIVGGWSGALPTEKCHFEEAEKVTCVTMEPTLSYHYQYPELVLVEDDYCI